MSAAVIGEDCDLVDDTEFDALRRAPEALAFPGNTSDLKLVRLAALTGPPLHHMFQELGLAVVSSSRRPDLGALREQFAAVGNSQQLWVHGKIWGPRRIAGRIPVSVLTDTGAGDGNYVSLGFWKSVQSWRGKAVSRKLSSRGKGALLAANPDSSGVPGMQIVGWTVLKIVFPREDCVRNILVRVVPDLPYRFILGASFFRANRSVISIEKGKGFQPSPGAPWLPFQSRSAGSKRSKEAYCAVRTPDIARPSHPGVEPDIPELPVCSLGQAA